MTFPEAQQWAQRAFSNSRHPSIDDIARVIQMAVSKPEADLKQAKEAINAAYDHMDRWGVASGGDEREHKSQERVFDLLRPWTYS